MHSQGRRCRPWNQTEQETDPDPTGRWFSVGFFTFAPGAAKPPLATDLGPFGASNILSRSATAEVIHDPFLIR